MVVAAAMQQHAVAAGLVGGVVAGVTTMAAAQRPEVLLSAPLAEPAAGLLTAQLTTAGCSASVEADIGTLMLSVWLLTAEWQLQTRTQGVQSELSQVG